MGLYLEYSHKLDSLSHKFDSVSFEVEKLCSHADLSCENPNFTTFASLLLVSTLIGVYFGWKDRRNKDETNYALGGRRFSALPVAVSLTATSLSAITMMGSPSEYYFYGSTYAWTILADAISCVVAALFTGSLKLSSIMNFQPQPKYQQPVWPRSPTDVVP